jgi:hypothetical protein
MMTLWVAGLAIGALFGFAWGYTAGRRSVIITLPAQTEALPDTREKGSERA